MTRIVEGHAMKTTSHQLGQTLLRWSSISVALACSACTSMSPAARLKTVENGPVHAVYQETVNDSAQARATRRGRMAEASAGPASSSVPGNPVVRRDPSFQQIAYAGPVPAAHGIQPAGGAHGAPWQGDDLQGQFNCPPADVECPPLPRWPAAGPNPMAPGMMACDACNVPSPESYPDEYLCDGGDRDWPVHYDNFSRDGLDTEDTVLEYTDRRGYEKMKPSNKVCVYAPRFASVRTVSQPHERHNVSELAGVGQLASTQGMSTRLKASKQIKREMMGGIAVRSRASGLDTDAAQGTVSQLRRPSAHDKVLNLYESMSFLMTGKLENTDTARLGLGLQNGMVWTRNEYPVITAKIDVPIEGHFEQSTAVITGIEEKEEAENLRIVKLADKKSALPGDEILFTIRYDNLGGREAHHIRIVDNLTPRLQYIVDSATSDRDGELVLQDNGEGSQILIWELSEPLPGNTGGIVTFKAKVR
ncbi:DUF11 domain-containing protein [Schlesneria paludicola]|uniref:DUF11 domain-containing protein n=1 Tax=Schlesneria paludicola TaxID=360056 RepID=UPI00029A1D6E|nr:DUF11 domain-containing protein [Schlesneria paludicola]